MNLAGNFIKYVCIELVCVKRGYMIWTYCEREDFVDIFRWIFVILFCFSVC